MREVDRPQRDTQVLVFYINIFSKFLHDYSYKIIQNKQLIICL
jgi:hypothetical protein